MKLYGDGATTSHQRRRTLGTTPGHRFGGALGAPIVPDYVDTHAIPGLARAQGPKSSAEQPPAWSPDSPLFWFAGLLAVTVGAIAFSSTVRLGKRTASVSVGETKPKET